MRQLLEKNIGDRSLFNAVAKAYKLSVSKDGSVPKLEASLWKALDLGLDQFAGRGKDHLIVMVDGLDELKSHENMKTIMEHFGQLSSKHARLQVVTFSRSSPSKPSKGSFQPFQIKPDHIHEDLRHVAEHALRGYAHYDGQSEHKQEAIIETLIHAAQGDFLWLLLNVYLLRKEPSFETFEKAVKAAKDVRQSLHQTIESLTKATDFSKPDTCHLLSWMLVAKRPLTVMEITCLLQIDLHKKQSIDRKGDVRNDIHTGLGPLVRFQDEFVRFRHPTIREYLLKIQLQGTSKLPKPQPAQTDFVMRLLAYCKFNLKRHQEPSLELISHAYAKDLFNQYALLEYSVHHWARHYYVSSMQSDGKDIQLSGDFKAIFPNSTLMVMLEWACWSSRTFSFERYEFALRIRELIFTEKHECVLQSLIVCGDISRKATKVLEAGTFFYRASQVGQAVLRKNHSLVITCTTTFLTIVESVKVTSRTELGIRKEEMLKYIIDVYKHQHGQTHDLVIRYYKMLAQLYVEIHEEYKAEAVWREVREIIILRFGKGSEVRNSACLSSVTIRESG